MRKKNKQVNQEIEKQEERPFWKDLVFILVSVLAFTVMFECPETWGIPLGLVLVFLTGRL